MYCAALVCGNRLCILEYLTIIKNYGMFAQIDDMADRGKLLK